MQGQSSVSGLTSAATIWVVAAIGIAIGAGFYIEAAGTGAFVTVVLAWLGRVEHKLRRIRRIVAYTVRAAPGTSYEAIQHTLTNHGVHVLEYQVFDHGEDRTFELRLQGPSLQFDTLADRLLARGDVMSVHGG
jgi:putative Mg2+ transporter-C (MgtC) family protein